MSNATPGQAGGIEVTREPEIPVYLVQMWLCDPCLDGEGEQCHTPGCSLWIHDAPKPAIRGSQGVTILGPALEPFMTREAFAARQGVAGKAVYELWRAAVPDVVCNVPGGPWEDLPATVQAGFGAIAAWQRQPAPARGKRDPLACPCCVFGGDDCWCPADCGVERCQARDPDAAPRPHAAPYHAWLSAEYPDVGPEAVEFGAAAYRAGMAAGEGGRDHDGGD